MAITSQKGQVITLEAAADLSAAQYNVVKVDTNGKAALIAATTDIPIGVLLNKPDAAGKAAQIQTSGLAEVRAGGACTAGTMLALDATVGRVIDSAADEDTLVGMCMLTRGDGDITKVLLAGVGTQRATA